MCFSTASNLAAKEKFKLHKFAFLSFFIIVMFNYMLKRRRKLLLTYKKWVGFTLSLFVYYLEVFIFLKHLLNQYFFSSTNIDIQTDLMNIYAKEPKLESEAFVYVRYFQICKCPLSVYPWTWGIVFHNLCVDAKKLVNIQNTKNVNNYFLFHSDM